jgi:branched-chain amino acid transport system ATP-binding protein
MPELLDVQGLTAGYGEAVVLTDVTFKVAEGQALALLGRNGMGKTTLVNSIIGVTRHIGGTIGLDGRNITGLRPDQRAHAGIGWVPQERNIFRSLTVEENMTAIARPGRWTLAKVYELFPRLAERRGNLGNQLSGGEQQMLAIARALILNPRIILLDEPLEGLAPILIAELLAALRKIIREEGLSAILVEQNAQKILGVTDRAIIVERGSIVYQGESAALKADQKLLETYVGVTDASAVSRKAQREAKSSAHPRASGNPVP